MAAGANARKVARLLIERGAQIDPIESQYGAAPIGYAAHYNHEAMIDLLTPYSRHVWTLAHREKWIVYAKYCAPNQNGRAPRRPPDAAVVAAK